MRNIEITYKNRFSSNSHFPHIHMNMECGYVFEFMKCMKILMILITIEWYGSWICGFMNYLMLKTNLKIKFL